MREWVWNNDVKNNWLGTFNKESQQSTDSICLSFKSKTTQTHLYSNFWKPKTGNLKGGQRAEGDGNTCNSITRVAESEGCQVRGQPSLHSVTLSQPPPPMWLEQKISYLQNKTYS